MVRLKGFNKFLQKHDFNNFNSTMVRLKVKYVKLNPYLKSHFNSTMVRLKEYAITILIIFYIIFQFHYGTIKRGIGICTDNTFV